MHDIISRSANRTTALALSFALSLLLAPLHLEAQVDEAEVQRTVESLVFESQRAGHIGHDLEAYMAAMTEDVRIVAGRGPDEGPYDWSIDRAGVEESRRLRFGEPVPPGTSIDFESVAFAVEGDTAVLSTRSTTTMRGATEVVGETYRLRRTAEGWRIYENRWWPMSADYGDGPVVMDEAYWAQADAAVEAARAASDEAALGAALQRAYRFVELHALLRELSLRPDASAELWRSRGFAALVIGDADDALASFQRARELDRSIEVPGSAE